MEKRFLKRLYDSINYSLNNLYVNNDDNKMSNNKQSMIKIVKWFNHEVWKYCCGKWFDRRNEEFCFKCGNK